MRKKLMKNHKEKKAGSLKLALCNPTSTNLFSTKPSSKNVFSDE